MSSFARFVVLVDDQVVSDRLLTWHDANMLAGRLLREGATDVVVKVA